MWVKICGLTNEEDALMAVALGADALGFVFAPSTRQVTPLAVRDITRRLPPDTVTIGVFRDHTPDQVVEAVTTAGLAGAQLHGHETPAQVAEVRRRVRLVIVALPAGSPQVPRAGDYDCDALLLDASRPGSGAVFDWGLADAVPPRTRLILAGGLTPANVGQAIAAVGPWGVDVSTGVEAAPGQKDALKVRDFIHAARAARPVSPGSPSEGPAAGDVSALPFDWDDTAELGRPRTPW